MENRWRSEKEHWAEYVDMLPAQLGNSVRNPPHGGSVIERAIRPVIGKIAIQSHALSVVFSEAQILKKDNRFFKRILLVMLCVHVLEVVVDLYPYVVRWL